MNEYMTNKDLKILANNELLKQTSPSPKLADILTMDGDEIQSTRKIKLNQGPTIKA